MQYDTDCFYLGKNVFTSDKFFYQGSQPTVRRAVWCSGAQKCPRLHSYPCPVRTHFFGTNFPNFEKKTPKLGELVLKMGEVIRTFWKSSEGVGADHTQNLWAWLFTYLGNPKIYLGKLQFYLGWTIVVRSGS